MPRHGARRRGAHVRKPSSRCRAYARAASTPRSRGRPKAPHRRGDDHPCWSLSAVSFDALVTALHSATRPRLSRWPHCRARVERASARRNDVLVSARSCGRARGRAPRACWRGPRGGSAVDVSTGTRLADSWTTRVADLRTIWNGRRLVLLPYNARSPCSAYRRTALRSFERLSAAIYESRLNRRRHVPFGAMTSWGRLVSRFPRKVIARALPLALPPPRYGGGARDCFRQAPGCVDGASSPLQGASLPGPRP